MDQRLSAANEANADYIPFPPTPVSVADMNVILAPLSQKVEKLTGITNGALANYDPVTHKAGTITCTLHNFSRTFDKFGKQFDLIANDLDGKQKDYQALHQEVRHVQETLELQNETLDDLRDQLYMITKTLITISERVDPMGFPGMKTPINHGVKREREREPEYQGIPHYAWPPGYNQYIQPIPSPDDRDSSRKYRK